MTFTDDIIEHAKARESDNAISFQKVNCKSVIVVGGENAEVRVLVDKHFNWFQKKAIEFVFGFKVIDYEE